MIIGETELLKMQNSEQKKRIIKLKAKVRILERKLKRLENQYYSAIDIIADMKEVERTRGENVNN